MKIFLYHILLIVGLFFTSCNGKKFEATMEERNDYNSAYNYMKHIRENLATKELEPSLREGLVEAADKIVGMGDVDKLEKEITHAYFMQGLERARSLKKTLMNEEEPLDAALFKTYEKKYLDIQTKIKKLKPDEIEKKLNDLGVDEITKKSITFMTGQIKRYNFQTFLDKTIIAPSQIEASLNNIEQLLPYDNVDDFIEDLKELTGEKK